MRSLRHPIFSLLILPLLGCTTEPTVILPDGAVEFLAPVAYTSWWSKTEGCAELTGRMDRVEWYVVPGVSTFPTDQGPKVGIRVKAADRITIVLAGDYQHHEMVVRHEMLHAILDKSGHPSLYFEERCRLTWSTWVEPGTEDGTTVAEDHKHGPELS